MHWGLAVGFFFSLFFLSYIPIWLRCMRALDEQEAWGLT